ncbi:hypothetical protein BL107_05939 [Synechococcus sp. BL107]|uniref:formyltransferase family protein n=1 Tax=Synechococcus sp. BL107 TaxID=313625 RepID=UPI0000E53BAA|nr:formyltransferase family protein [Synechococcus sp. BL107]EAU71047.1 hypothetical protein BL107_05939 [Synechococcus sp. BL107]
MSLSVCCFSSTGLELLNTLVRQNAKIATIFTSSADSEEIISEIKKISESIQANFIYLDANYEPSKQVLANCCEKNIDILLLLWWPHILKNKVIDEFEYIVNLHPSLLPFGRGKYGYFWSLIHNEPFGATLHLVDEGIDSGKILAQKHVAKTSILTGEQLYLKGVIACKSLFEEEIMNIVNNLEINILPKNELDTAIKGSYHSKKSYLEFCSQMNNKKHTIYEAITYLKARTFESGHSFKFTEDGKTYECHLSLRELAN